MDSLLDSAPCGFLSLGDDGTIRAINSTLLQRLGFLREALEGRSVELILTMGGRIFYQTHFFPMLKLRGSAREIFLLLQTSAGEQVGVLCNADRRERDGAMALDCVFVEVAERKKFEDALLRAKQEAEAASRELTLANEKLEEQAVELELQQEKLQDQAVQAEEQGEALQSLNEDLRRERAAADEANHAKSAFLAVMSHELRTPLNAIGGYVQLLEMGLHGPVSEEQKGALARIDRSQRHLLRLINDILNLSRIEAGKVDYKIEIVQLREVVENMTPMIYPQVASKSLHLEVDVPEHLMVSGDREKIQQIILNLLTNAIKFTSEGGIVRIEAGDDGSDRIYLTVIDNGIGIPAEMTGKVFEPFVQVDTSRSRAVEGTGLGLSISRDLARGMGGDLTLTSVLDSGSEFRMTLLRADAGAT